MKGPQRNKNTENDAKKSEDRRSKPDFAEIKAEPPRLPATPSSINRNLTSGPAKATPPATPTRKSSQNLERTSVNLDRASQNLDDNSRRFSASSNLNTSRKPVDMDLDLELDDIDLDGIDLEDLDLDLDDKKDNKFSRKSSASSYSTPPMTRPSQIKESSATPSMNESIDQISGVNKNLCSLAQAYFSGPAKKPTVTRKPSVKETPEPTAAPAPMVARNPTPAAPAPMVARNITPPEPDLEAEEEEKIQKEKESLVAAFFGKPTKPTKAPQQNTKVIERASFAPTAGAAGKGSNRSSVPTARGAATTQVNDDREMEELEELEKIMEGSGAVTRKKEPRTPSPPPRGPLDKQALMVRMLGNVNGILNGKIKPGKK